MGDGRTRWEIVILGIQLIGFVFEDVEINTIR
jgi:hypothetical protein